MVRYCLAPFPPHPLLVLTRQVFGTNLVLLGDLAATQQKSWRKSSGASELPNVQEGPAACINARLFSLVVKAQLWSSVLSGMVKRAGAE